jgi:hypothetical protein
VRDVHIPWPVLTDVSSRWNLKITAGDRTYNAWALSSEVERRGRASGGMFRMPIPGRLHGVVNADPKPSTTVPKATAQSVALLITSAKQEYDGAVARGELPPAPGTSVEVTWVPLAIAVLLLPAVAVVALTLR